MGCEVVGIGCASVTSFLAWIMQILARQSRAHGVLVGALIRVVPIYL